ncbi:MAG: hypothetical protein L0216_09840 [Planctomycetales bacterium]|nr:hypothetical protein [Planctomycetales bacterium]
MRRSLLLLACAGCLSVRGEPAAGTAGRSPRGSGTDPGETRAARLLQIERLQRGEIARVLAEARARVRAEPRSPAALYLLGRLLGDPDEQRRLFRSAADRDPSFALARYALGFVDLRARRHASARDHLAAARDLAAEEDRGDVLQPLAQACAAGRDWRAAEEVLREAEVARPGDPGPGLLRSRIAEMRGELPGAHAAAREALDRSNGADRAARRVLDLLHRPGAGAEERASAEIVEKIADGEGPGLMRLRALLLARRGDLGGARAALEAAVRMGEDPAAVASELRLLHVRRGDPRAALAAEEPFAPRDLVCAPENAVRGRYLELHAAGEAWAAAGPLGAEDGAARLRFARAAARAGWLDEAEAALPVLAGDGAVRESALELGRRIQAHRRFVAWLCDEFTEGYISADQGDGPVDLESALRRIGVQSLAVLGRDLATGTRIVRFPLLGEVVDPRPGLAGPLSAYFLEEWNHHILLGRRAGRPPEAVLLRVVSLRLSEEKRLWGRPLRLSVLLGEQDEDLQLRSQREHEGAEVAGAAFADGFYVDLGSVRRAEWEARALLRLPDGRRAALRGLEAPRAGDAGSALALLDDRALPAALRLRAYEEEQPLARGPLAAGLSLAETLAVETHEMAHVADARAFLPLGSHPLDLLALLARSGLSPAGVEVSLEEHAAWASLAHAPSPHAVLAHLASFLPEPESSPPHSAAYVRVLRDLVLHLYDRAEEYPALDRSRVILHQTPRLSPEELRRAAWACARARGWAPREVRD